MKKKGIAFKLIILILVSQVIIFSVISHHNSNKTRQIQTRSLQENTRNISLAALNQIEAVMRAVEKIPEQIAYSLEHSSYTEKEMYNLIQQVIKKNSEIFGSTIAFEPYGFDSNRKFFAPYYYKKDDKQGFTYLDGVTYPYLTKEWYQIPKKLKAPIWSEPYFDAGAGNIIMTTYSVPFYRTVNGERTLSGVVTADISLDWLKDLVDSIQTRETAIILVSKEGSFISHPDPKLIMKGTIFDLAKTRNDARLRQIGQSMIQGESEFIETTRIIPGVETWFFYAPLPSNGWSMGVLYLKDELMKEHEALQRSLLAFAFFGGVLLLIAVVIISKSITKPLGALAKTTEEISKGNFDFKVPNILSQDEVGTLSRSFERMERSLKKHIADLTKISAEKERIETELQFATLVQNDFLPDKMPTHSSFRFAAKSFPAKFVGGDFYDFVEIDSQNIGIVFGDVSGKGVSGALYMARLLSDFRYIGPSSDSSRETMIKVNSILHSRSRRGMFATAVYMILNLETKMLRICNAGHHPLFLRKRDGSLQQIGQSSGIPIGIFPEVNNYTEEILYIEGGDCVLLYTDGVIEPINDQGEMFGSDRLQKIFARHEGNPEELIWEIDQSVEEFTPDQTDFDDLTLMVIKAL